MTARMMVAAGAVIRDELRRVLLVKHVPSYRSYWAGKWICPGGRLKMGESIREAALREVEEETGLRVELLSPVEPYEGLFHQGGELDLHVVYLTFRARPLGGDLKPDSDVGEAEWVAPERLPDIWDDLHRDTQRLMVLAGVVERT
ncbi:MAG: NUDIX hydrolase [SAR202 cluster bacterium]|nr:NUDIX hydrolase [SAR202 cluster bacterium]